LSILISGLPAGSPETTAVPYLLPPPITDAGVVIEKPLVLTLSL
jgi:hypothetical protein